MSISKSETEVLYTEAEKLLGSPIRRFDKPADSSPAVVTVIGDPQQNLTGLVLDALGEKDEAIGRRFVQGYHCTIVYGAEKKICCVDGSDRFETDSEQIAELLSGTTIDSDILNFEIALPCEKLKGMTLRLLASNKDYAELSFDDVVLNSDYCMMTLRATALLSISERRILRNILVPAMDNELDVLVTNSHLVHSEEMDGVKESLSTFFKCDRPAFYLTDSTAPVAERFDYILGKAAELRTARLMRIAQREKFYAHEEVKKRREELRQEDELLADAQALLMEKARNLTKLQEAANRRCRMNYLSQLDVECSVAVSDFYSAIMTRVREEIDRGKNIRTMQNLIPGYLRSEWERLISEMTNRIGELVPEIENYLTEYIVKDIQEYLAYGGNDDMSDFVVRLTNRQHSANFIYARKLNISRSKSSALEKGGAIAGSVILVLSGHPILGAGLAGYELFLKNKLPMPANAANKEALKKSAGELCAIYNATAMEWIENMMNDITKNIETIIAESYRSAMESITSAIVERQSCAETRSEELEALARLEAQLV